jgi:hypothetical protein
MEFVVSVIEQQVSVHRFARRLGIALIQSGKYQAVLLVCKGLALGPQQALPYKFVQFSTISCSAFRSSFVARSALLSARSPSLEPGAFRKGH